MYTLTPSGGGGGGYAGLGPEFDAGTSGAAKTIDWDTNGQNQRLTLTDDAALTFVAPAGGPASLLLKLTQDGTGSRAPTLPASVRAPGGAIDLASAPGTVSLWALYWDGSLYWMTSAVVLAGSVTVTLVP